MVDRVLALPEGTRLYLLAPIVRGRKGEYRKEFLELRRQGFQRVKVDGELYELEEVPELDKKRSTTIEVVVDRVVDGAPELAQRLADSVETALRPLRRARDRGGRRFGERADLMSAKFACPVSGFTLPEIEPRLFSFNNPYGACPACDGIGTKMLIDPALVVPDPTSRSPRARSSPGRRRLSPYYPQTLAAICKHFKASLTSPGASCRSGAGVILYGRAARRSRIELRRTALRRYESKQAFEGVHATTCSGAGARPIERWCGGLVRYMSSTPCEACRGYRLSPRRSASRSPAGTSAR